MTEQITILTPNLAVMGLEIQENVLKGYRLKDGYPAQLAWQFEAIMNLIEQPVVPTIQQATEPAQKQLGRPKGSGKVS